MILHGDGKYLFSVGVNGYHEYPADIQLGMGST